MTDFSTLLATAEGVSSNHSILVDIVNALRGLPIVRAFPFRFDTPGILTGAALYTPNVGDVLLDAWVEIDTAWNGTTPLGDAGQFLSGEVFGWFGSRSGPIPMNNADAATGAEIAQSMLTQGASGAAISSSLSMQAFLSATKRCVPAKFTTADPVKVVVSQDGNVGGASPGSSQGAGVLYLTTTTPR